MGSLTVTGPTGVEVGAKGKLGAVATEDLIDFLDSEIGCMAQVAPGGGSGTDRQGPL